MLAALKPVINAALAARACNVPPLKFTVLILAPPPLTILAAVLKIPPLRLSVPVDVPAVASDPSVMAVFTIKVPPPRLIVPAAKPVPAAVLVPMVSVATVIVPASKLNVPATFPVLLAMLLFAIKSVPQKMVDTWPETSNVPLAPPAVAVPLLLATVIFEPPVPALFVMVSVPGLPGVWVANWNRPVPPGTNLPIPTVSVSA